MSYIDSDELLNPERKKLYFFTEILEKISHLRAKNEKDISVPNH